MPHIVEDQRRELTVVNDALIRDCIEFESGTEQADEKRRITAFHAVTAVNLGFRHLRCISNINGLTALTKLQLDNNSISKIEGLECLVNLTWLDLSFNKITRIEGISTLTKLTDLSLLSNNIEVLENMDALASLNVLSIGTNLIKDLTQVMYLRRFRNLQLLNLAGNPICKNSEYRPYVLSHTWALKFLDYRLIDAHSILAAKEQYQDEMLELSEREEAERLAELHASERASREREMAAANLAGVEGLFDAMMKADNEQGKLNQVPGLLDGIQEVADSWRLHAEEFVAAMQAQFKLKQAEQDLWREAVEQLIVEREAEARAYIAERESEMRAQLEFASNAVQKRHEEEAGQSLTQLRDLRGDVLDRIQDSLMAVESAVFDGINELNAEFDRAYGEMVDASKGIISGFFTQVRDLENAYCERVCAQAGALMEKAAATADADDGGGFSDEARAVLTDKDALNNALQASHDSHLTAIDGGEDRLISEEVRRYATLVGDARTWENTRNRDRISEILGLVSRWRVKADDLLTALEAMEF